MMSESSRSFPIALKLAGRLCIVVGSDDDAAARVTDLLAADAKVRVIASAPCEALTLLAEDARVELRTAPLCEADLDGAWLIVQTERNPQTAVEIARLAQARQIFFCAVDQPKFNSFSHLAIARAGALSVAIGTEGRAPSFGRRLRLELERLFSASRLAEFVAELHALRQRTPSEQRREVLTRAAARLSITGEIRIADSDSDL